MSAVVPVHNDERFLSAAVNSALSQTDASVEVIVVDDASTDRTPEVLDRFGSAIRVVRTQRNMERGAARNRGARVARGEILAFLDADDEWCPEKIRAQIPYALRGEPSVTGVDLIDSDGRVVGRHVPPPALTRRVLFTYNPVFGGPSSLVIPRAVFESVGGFPETRAVQGSEDWIFFADLVATGQKIAVLPRRLTRYRVHDRQGTADPEAMAKSMWAAGRWLEEHQELTQQERQRMRLMRATAIGRAFAAKGLWVPAARWGATALRGGSLSAGIGGICRIAASGLAGAARRRGAHRLVRAGRG